MPHYFSLPSPLGWEAIHCFNQHTSPTLVLNIEDLETAFHGRGDPITAIKTASCMFNTNFSNWIAKAQYIMLQGVMS